MPEEIPQQQNRHGKRCEAGFGKCHLKGFQPQCDGDPVCCHCGNGGRQQGTIFQFPDCQHFQCKADCRQRCVKQPAETGSHSGNGQNGNGIGNAPEPRNPAADVVGNRGSQLYSDTLSSGTAARRDVSATCCRSEAGSAGRECVLQCRPQHQRSGSCPDCFLCRISGISIPCRHRQWAEREHTRSGALSGMYRSTAAHARIRR